MERVINFGAGPSVLPEEVLLQIQQQLLNTNSSGVSILEMSHRTKEFERILHDCKKDLCNFMQIPDDYSVLFCQGGATLQFSMINYLLGSTEKAADYVVSGVWSRKAMEEAIKMGYKVNVVVDFQAEKLSIPPIEKWNWSSNPSFVYYCDNETVDGIEFPTDYVSRFTEDKIIVCDMSSNFMTRRVKISDYGIIFAGAQKNLGIAGVTIVIIKKSLINYDGRKNVPTMMDYSILSKNDSMYNTPPTFAIYVCSLIIAWTRRKFNSIEAVEEFHNYQKNKIYAVIDQKFINSVPLQYRSRINIVFKTLESDKRLLQVLNDNKIIQVEGHRLVGGFRLSIYNAMTEENIDFLLKLLRDYK